MHGGTLVEPLLGTLSPPSPPASVRPATRRNGLLPVLCLSAFLVALVESTSFQQWWKVL